MNVAQLIAARITVDPPAIRPRRLRRSAALRTLVRETRIHAGGLIQPLFCVPGSNVQREIASMPGIFHQSAEHVVAECKALHALGVGAVLLFGLPEFKDAHATANYDPNGVVQRAIAAIKRALPEMIVVADLCNCEYTDHGHCGPLDDRGDVDNDATLALLARTALTYADAGVDVIAPSDMMDGRVRVLRTNLDAHGHQGVAIMSYAAKFASAFYGPFREAADSTPQSGDRTTYQMDPANAREALREVELDVAEGADIVIVKPALAYMDVIAKVRASVRIPVACYNVSGEYAMVKAAAANGWIDEAKIVDEMLLGFARAGADIIITYFAKEYAQRHA